MNINLSLCFLESEKMRLFQIIHLELVRTSMKNLTDPSKYEQRVYQNYRELIEFINDLYFSQKTAIFLIYLPNLTLITDLIIRISGEGVWQNLGLIGISELVFKVAYHSSIFLTIVCTLILLLLFMPIGLSVYVLLKTQRVRNEENICLGYFYSIYKGSLVGKIFQIFFKSYERVWFPVMVSVGIKLIGKKNDLGAGYQTAGIFIIVLAFITSFLFEYFDLQIVTVSSGEEIYTKPNFPNNLIDTILLFVSLILINSTSGMTPFISCLSIYSVRVILAYFLKYQTGVFYRENIFILLCGTSISLAVLLGKLTDMEFLMMLSSAMAIFVLICIKSRFEYQEEEQKRQDKYKKISPYEEEMAEFEEKALTSLEDLKAEIKKGKMTKAYRELVFLSRKKNSHREQLIIDVMKNKCYKLEIMSRGGAKVTNACSLLQYEEKSFIVLEKILIISNLAIELLGLLKHKDPKKEIFLIKTMKLIEEIQKTKDIINKTTVHYRAAVEINCLIEIIFKDIYNDGLFLRKINKEKREQILSEAHKQSQKKLFDRDVTLVIISIMDEVGKIKRVSKNLPNVLEYQLNQLVGISINQLMPHSIREIHDDILIDFVDTFNAKKAKKNPSLMFYAINKSFHLQKVTVHYNFIMNHLDGFELSGIMKKIKTEEYVIITDMEGNLQGWTKQAGELFNLDEVAGNDCHIFNFMPMIPSMVKYTDQSTCISTILFAPNRIKNQKLIICDPKNPTSNPELIHKRQISVFYQMLESESFVESYIANITQEIRTLKNGAKSLKVFYIEELQRIDKIDKVISLITRKEQTVKEETLLQNKSLMILKSSHDIYGDSIQQEYSLNKNKKNNKCFDLNFTEIMGKQNTFDISQINILKDYNSKSSVTLASNHNIKNEKTDASVEDKLNDLNDNLALDSIFNPKLQRNNLHLWLIIVVTLGFLIILIFSEVGLKNLQGQVTLEIESIRKSNRAELIMAKSVFNPNITYTRQFKSGKLLVHSKWMLDKSSKFYDFHGNPVDQNWFYMFNVQIPSTLDRIIRETDPTLLEMYRGQLEDNFPSMVKAFHERIQIEKALWSATNDDAKMSLIIKLVAVGVGSSLYVAFIVFTYKRHSNQRKMNEAFFKFQRHDLNDKIKQIEGVARVLEQKSDQWFIQQQFKDLKKKYENKFPELHKDQNKRPEQKRNCSYIEGLQNTSELIPNGHGRNQMMAYDEIQEDIRKKKVTVIIGFVIIFIIIQLLFLIIYGIFIIQEVDTSKEVPTVIQKAYKLSVLPNLQIADLFCPISDEIINTYDEQVNQLLESPNELVPNIFNIMKNPPCSDCPFMSQIMNTNYRSFYSYFNQLIKEKKETGNLDITEMYLAIDYITETINKNLETRKPRPTWLIILLYVVSLVFFFVGLFLWVKEIRKEDDSIESFLKFFDSQILFKNKHMSSLISKNL